MSWLLYAVTAATGFGALSIISKKLMEDTSAIVFTILSTVLATVFYSPIFVYYVLNLSLDFRLLAIMALFFSMIGNIAGYLLYNLAIKTGEISRTVPVRRLNPIFTAVIAAFLLGEAVDLSLGTGIILSTIGMLVVLKEDDFSYLGSLKDEVHQKAILMAFGSAVVYGFTAVIDRYATQIIHPKIYTFLMLTGMVCGYLTIGFLKEQEQLSRVKETFRENMKVYIGSGMVATVSTFSIFTALSLAPAAKVATVQQLQILIPVIVGGELFREENVARKVLGSIVLITGIILVSI